MGTSPLKMDSSNSLKRVFNIFVKACLITSSAIAVLVTVGIIFSLIVQSLRFFAEVSFIDFLFGLEWKPQSALQTETGMSVGAFGAIPLFVGTFLISFIALCVAAPFGIFSAIYLAEYAGERKRAFIKPALEILAGVPTVVYGFFAAIVIAPFIRNLGSAIGLDVASEAAISAGIVMGVMIIPLVSSLSDDVISAVPLSLKEGSIGLGATKSETVRQVILPAALPGIAGSMLLAASRAVGETMIVVMAAGLAAQLSFNPLEAVTTVTVQIVLALTGDQEFDSAKTLVAFALGLTLFIITLTFNILGNWIVKRYKEAYD
ncbi:phosphate ABC transporter permease subunit PstC [Kordiimonas sp. SCSIO 12610]|nr:phosphate ABC transporter permease subunit PstC [Kordiimonas sp. SCSIO 12610]UTW55389.1 phosphate ABC transporter permease subunit PstC [Kordiimonas sp. SCSIO 12610]